MKMKMIKKSGIKLIADGPHLGRRNTLKHMLSKVRLTHTQEEPLHMEESNEILSESLDENFESVDMITENVDIGKIRNLIPFICF